MSTSNGRTKRTRTAPVKDGGKSPEELMEAWSRKYFDKYYRDNTPEEDLDYINSGMNRLQEITKDLLAAPSPAGIEELRRSVDHLRRFVTYAKEWRHAKTENT